MYTSQTPCPDKPADDTPVVWCIAGRPYPDRQRRYLGVGHREWTRYRGNSRRFDTKADAIIAAEELQLGDVEYEPIRNPRGVKHPIMSDARRAELQQVVRDRLTRGAAQLRRGARPTST